jgi:hypothetical protein
MVARYDDMSREEKKEGRKREGKGKKTERRETGKKKSHHTVRPVIMVIMVIHWSYRR